MLVEGGTSYRGEFLMKSTALCYSPHPLSAAPKVEFISIQVRRILILYTLVDCLKIM